MDEVESREDIQELIHKELAAVGSHLEWKSNSGRWQLAQQCSRLRALSPSVCIRYLTRRAIDNYARVYNEWRSVPDFQAIPFHYARRLLGLSLEDKQRCVEAYARHGAQGLKTFLPPRKESNWQVLRRALRMARERVQDDERLIELLDAIE